MHVSEDEVTAVVARVPLEGEGHQADDSELHFAGDRDGGMGGVCRLKQYLAILVAVAVDLAAEVCIVHTCHDDVAVHGFEPPVEGDEAPVEHASLNHRVANQPGVISV